MSFNLNGLGSVASAATQVSSAKTAPQPFSDPRFNPTGPKSYVILKRHIPKFAEVIDEATGCKFPTPLRKMMVEYLAGAGGNLVDRTEWIKRFEIDIGPETVAVIDALNIENFYKVYWGPNPVDLYKNAPVIRQVCEVCKTPFVRPPDQVVHKGTQKDYCLDLLGEVANHPKDGHPIRYTHRSEVLIQLGRKKPGPSKLVVWLKGGTAFGKPWSEKSQDPRKMGQVQELEDMNAKTGCGCNTKPDIVTQVTASIIDYNITGEIPPGEDREWYRTADTVEIDRISYHAGSGYMRKAEDPAPAGLHINDDHGAFVHEIHGVGVER